VPFGAVGNTSAGHVIFERGSIQIPSASKIKLLAQHNTNDPIGRAQSFNETAQGINGVFKLSAASKAQDYLVMASEGLIDGLSVGVEVLASRERKDGVMIVSSAVLKEVSLVESPAFSDARVLEVVASEGEEEVTEEVTTEDSAPVEVAEETPTTESEAAVSVDTTPATTEAAAAAEASRPIIKAAAPYSTAPRHDIISMGKYVEHKVKAALGDDTSRQYVAAAEDPKAVQAAADSMSTNPAFNPIQYLSNFVSNTNFGRPTIDAVSRGTLPASGLTLNIPSLVTSAGGGSSVAPTVAETAESAAPSDTGMTSAYQSVSIKKYAGQQTISLELLERSDPIFFDQLAIQLERAYKLATDSAMVGILAAQGTQAATTAATNAGLISFISTEAPAAYKGSSYFASNLVANTDWWGTIMGYTDTTGRPIYNAIQPMNAAGQVAPSSIKGNVLGLDLYVDKNVTAGLVDDSAFIIAPETAYWWESPEAFFSVNVVNSMSVQTAIYGYGAGKVLIPAGVRRFNLV
jgi:HK97 family phage prohead protease/HK97 family phage major capsid protein